MKRGFSLLELMVVVAIIAFLASLAIPRYFAYFAKAKQAEATMLLASLHTAQQTYWAEHGKYTDKLSGPDSINWQPDGYNGGGKNAAFYYTYGFNVPGGKEGVHYFTGKLETPPTALGLCKADKDGFLAKAAGNLSAKHVADVWSIDESRSIKHEQNGIS